jgi:hypothetical protein
MVVLRFLGIILELSEQELVLVGSVLMWLGLRLLGIIRTEGQRIKSVYIGKHHITTLHTSAYTTRKTGNHT